MNRLPQPTVLEQVATHTGEVNEAVRTVIDQWIDQQVAQGVDRKIALSAASSGLLSVAFRCCFQGCELTPEQGHAIAVRMTLTLAALCRDAIVEREISEQETGDGGQG